MEGKKSFVLYADLIDLVNELPIEKRGELFTIILEYVNDLDPQITDPLLRVAFTPIKQALKRDLEKWKGIVDRNRENGAKGGRPPKKPKKPSGLSDNPKKPKKPDNVSVDDSDTDNENDSTCRIGVTSFFDVFNTIEFQNELEFKGYIIEDAKRNFERFCKLNNAKIFDTADHLKNTFFKFLGIKHRADYSKDPQAYMGLLKTIEVNGDIVLKILEMTGLSSEVWNQTRNEFEDYAVQAYPVIENEDHVFNILSKFCEHQKSKLCRI